MINLQFCTFLFLLGYVLYKITGKIKIFLLYFICNIPFCFIHGNYTFFMKLLLMLSISLLSILPLILCIITNVIANKYKCEILSDIGIVKINGKIYTGKYKKFLIFMGACGWFTVCTAPFIFLIPYVTIL